MVQQNILIRTILIAIIGAQFLFLCTQELFGDESFYWLESQFLDWSYAELPGWTAWMIRVGAEIFGNHYFAVRITAFLAYLSVFYFTIKINQRLNNTNVNLNLLLIASVPIYLLLATMALPDIWMLFFVVWISYFLLKATAENKTRNWLVLGFFVACSLNVHVRMWIWLFVASLSFLWVYRPKKEILKPLLLICLPISLLGLLPVFIFNYINDFPLLQFQLVDRQPWQFQIRNLAFLLSQFLVISPLITLLWFKLVYLQSSTINSNKFIRWLLFTAWVHFVFYVLMSLFADGLRTTVHWLVVSYIPVLAIATKLMDNKKQLVSAISVGLFTSLIAVLYLVFVESNIKARIINNSSGWQVLAKEVAETRQQQNTKLIIADYFMTASQLGFELGNTTNIKVLNHEKNKKHGREKQLQLMGLLLEEPKSLEGSALLVVEHSAIKLQNQAKYYLNLCQQFDSLEYLKSVNDLNSTKQYHLFLVNQGDKCQIPPLFYINHQLKLNTIELSGWVIYHQVGIKELHLEFANQSIKIENFQVPNPDIQKQFPEIIDPQAPNNAFKTQIDKTELKTLRVKALTSDHREFHSPVYYIN